MCHTFIVVSDGGYLDNFRFTNYLGVMYEVPKLLDLVQQVLPLTAVLLHDDLLHKRFICVHAEIVLRGLACK